MAEEKGILRMFQPKISPKARKFYGWIRLVVMGNKALTICESPIYRESVKLEPTDRKTLRKYILTLADIVGLVIKDTIGKGNCIAAGWPVNDTHFVAVLSMAG
jgi:flagella basal body P-ring formation protein FlgA